ncbi:helix-turn-helix domain-containing protein, partial [Leptolyngbya sp. FACHB-16]|uniref:helix-turn-helix domain-containing protein n=1 Tax=unclassified Leptolyngbya TaxID=2650499 RepID=UPI001688682F
MAKKKYIVALTEQERETLEKLTTTGKTSAYKMNHARILLKADINRAEGGWTDEAISDALDISIATIERVRQRFVETSLEAALTRQVQHQRKARRLDGEQEARLITMTCGEVPDGRARWSLRLLAEKMVELEYVESISHETIRQTLK